MNILITGGAGFIGCNAADHYLEKGNNVTVIDNLSRKGTDNNISWLQEKYKDNLRFINADVSKDNDVLEKEVSAAEVVLHFAAQVAVTSSVEDPMSDFKTNALGTLNMLEAVRKSDNKPIMIYSSTNKVYGGMEDIKVEQKDGRYEYKYMKTGVSEERILDFHSPYGCSKGSSDQYVRDYSRIYGLRTVVFRQSCIFGERQFGMEDQGWLAWFTIAALLDKKLTIYGDGRQVRDVLYIKDLINAFDLAIRNIDKSKGQVYNIGGGPKNTLSLLELIDMLKELLDKDIKPGYDDWRPGDQPVFICDISKAKKELGWEPKVGASEGVKKLVGWIIKNKKLFED